MLNFNGEICAPLTVATKVSPSWRQVTLSALNILLWVTTSIPDEVRRVFIDAEQRPLFFGQNEAEDRRALFEARHRTERRFRDSLPVNGS